MANQHGVLIRPLQISDAQAYAQYMRRAEVYVPAAALPPADEATARRQIAQMLRGEQVYAVLAPGDHAMIGHVEVAPRVGRDGGPDEQNVEIAYVLSPSYWHRGLMTDALLFVLERLFGAGVQNVWASVYAGNTPSQQLLNRLGFQQTGEIPAPLLQADAAQLQQEWCLSKADWVSNKDDHSGKPR